jgi:Uma2 family endonuclease
VLLAVEVVSRGSRREDRGSKPLAYAEAGIPHYWLVESPASGASALTVHTFNLDSAAGKYVPDLVHHRRLTATLLAPIDIDLTRLTF